MLKGAIKLFTIKGIEVRLDYSWFIIFVLVTWSLGAGYFPHQYPDWPNPLYWVIGFITSILFFLSVLFHELSHSFVAIARGIKVPRITLFIFGGAAQIADEPESAGDEFVMALAGPAMSIGIGAVSAGLWYLFKQVGVEPLSALFGWLALINVMLAVFNLIPGYPLDGGRVLRALVWGATRDMAKSTRVAAAAGRGVAFFFIFIGVYLVFQGAMLNGIWIAFIGWFLLTAASQSSRQEAFKAMLTGHTAGEVMWTDCPMVDASTPVSDLVYKNIMHTGHRCFPVVEKDTVSGIVTLHNIRTLKPEQWSYSQVRSIMVPAQELKSVTPETPLPNVMQLMAGNGVNQVPVVKDGKFQGMVTREGLMEFIRTRSELGLDKGAPSAREMGLPGK